MKQFKQLILLLVLSVFGSVAIAQDNKRFEFGLTMGLNIMNSDSLEHSDNIDYINYLERTDHNYLPEPYIGVSAKWRIDHQSTLTTQALFWSDFSVEDFHLTYSYLINSFIGFNTGIYTNSNYLSCYESYRQISDPNFIDLNQNIRQIKLKERGVLMGPKLAIEKERFRFYMDGNIAIGFYKPFSDRYVLKEDGGNKRIEYRYQIVKQCHFAFAPSASIAYDVYDSEVCNIGLCASFSYYKSIQSIIYTKQYAEWTSDNYQAEIVNLPDHTISRCHPSLSVYWRW